MHKRRKIIVYANSKHCFDEALKYNKGLNEKYEILDDGNYFLHITATHEKIEEILEDVGCEKRMMQVNYPVASFRTFVSPEKKRLFKEVKQIRGFAIRKEDSKKAFALYN